MGFANQIKVATKLLNCRLEPSMNTQVLKVIKMGEIHNIIAEINGWGQLEDGSWVNLSFTVPYKTQESIEIKKDFMNGIDVEENTSEAESRMKDTVEYKEEVEVEKKIKTNSEAETKTEDTVNDNLPIHKVKKKESLQDIAEFWYGEGYGDRYIEIKEFNHLKSDILRVGMTLKIPNINV